MLQDQIRRDYWAALLGHSFRLPGTRRAVAPFGNCDCCGKKRPLSRCWAPGDVETFACDECRGIEP